MPFGLFSHIFYCEYINKFQKDFINKTNLNLYKIILSTQSKKIR